MEKMYKQKSKGVEEGRGYKRKDAGKRIKILKKTITLIFLCNFAKGKSYFTDKKQDFFAFIRNSFAHKIREDKNLVIISCFKSRS